MLKEDVIIDVLLGGNDFNIGITYMARPAMFLYSFCIHNAASSYWVSWVLLGLSRRQYKVYDKKISPTNKETL